MTDPDSHEILAAGVSGLPVLYRSGRMDPNNVVHTYLDRIATYDGRIQAFVSLCAHAALDAAAKSAARWRNGTALSPLDGVPIAIKANIALAGMPWTAGIAAYRDKLAEYDASCVALLKDAGAIVLGLTNMDEAALGAIGDNPWFGRTHNPARHGFTAGGSSCGSAAAVAAGLCAAAIGTDTIGSIRIPAAYCGVVGHKPKRGLIPTTGVIPLSPTLDTAGIIARSSMDCQSVMRAFDLHRDLVDRPFARHKLAVLDFAGIVPLEPVVATAFAATIEKAARADADIVTLRLCDFDFVSMQRLLFIVAETEGARVHARAMRDQPNLFSPALIDLLRWGATTGNSKIEAVLDQIGFAAAKLKAVLSEFDALLLPATPHPAFSFEAATPADQSVFCTLGSCLGWPSTVFPIGVTGDGLPLAAQVVSPREAQCLSLAQALAF